MPCVPAINQDTRHNCTDFIPGDVGVFQGLGDCNLRLGRLEVAAGHYTRSVTLLESQNGTRHQRGVMLGNLAWIHRASGRHDQVEPLLEASVALLEGSEAIPVSPDPVPVPSSPDSRPVPARPSAGPFPASPAP